MEHYFHAIFDFSFANSLSLNLKYGFANKNFNLDKQIKLFHKISAIKCYGDLLLWNCRQTMFTETRSGICGKN